MQVIDCNIVFAVFIPRISPPSCMLLIIPSAMSAPLWFAPPSPLLLPPPRVYCPLPHLPLSRSPTPSCFTRLWSTWLPCWTRTAPRRRRATWCCAWTPRWGSRTCRWGCGRGGAPGVQAPLLPHAAGAAGWGCGGGGSRRAAVHGGQRACSSAQSKPCC